MPDDWQAVPRYRPWAALSCGGISRSDFYKLPGIRLMVLRWRRREGRPPRLHCDQCRAGREITAITGWDQRGAPWPG